MTLSQIYTNLATSTARKTNYYGEIAYQLKNRQILKSKELKVKLYIWI